MIAGFSKLIDDNFCINVIRNLVDYTVGHTTSVDFGMWSRTRRRVCTDVGMSTKPFADHDAVALPNAASRPFQPLAPGSVYNGITDKKSVVCGLSKSYSTRREDPVNYDQFLKTFSLMAIRSLVFAAHDFPTQFLNSAWSPEQFRDILEGTGRSQFRKRYWIPDPHVAVHFDHGPHSLQPPFT